MEALPETTSSEAQLFPSFIRKQLNLKKMRLREKMLAEGREHASKECVPFITDLKNIFLEVEKSKIDYIIDLAHDLIVERLQEIPISLLT